MSENDISRDDASLSQTSSGGLLELHRRCFSCCNVVLRQEALLQRGHDRIMLLEQTNFTEHPKMKAIMARVSDQRYSDVKGFVDDITNLVNECVAECDQRAVLGALMTHVAKTDQPDHKRLDKTTFHGFPHPLLEEMLAQTAAARKKMPPNKAHVTVDVGRYLARAYGLGLASGAQFTGQPSKEKAFHAQRKEREIEWANTGAEAAAAGSKAQKRHRAKERGVEGAKKKQKLQPLVPNAAVTPKPTRSLRGTRRVVSEDSADEIPRVASSNGVAARKAKDTPAVASDAVVGKVRSAAVAQRILKRDRIQCPHVQGKQVEMCDEDYEPANGHGYRGIIQGTMIACLCGCEATMKGVHWLIHNGGRPNNRNPGYPWKYMKLVKGGRIEDHWLVCECPEDLCDSCRSWEAPGFPMTTCWKCRTSIHAVEECAIRLSEKSAAQSAPSRSRPARRKAPVRAKADAAGSDSSSDSSADERDAEDPNAGEWLCQICSGERTEKARFPYNCCKKQ